jgi:hypothetical protein
VLVNAVVILALFVGLQFMWFGPGIGQIILGRQFDTSNLAWGGIFLAFAGRLITDIIRDPLDAYSAIPYSLISYAAGLAALFGSWYICQLAGCPPLQAVVVAILAGFLTMGAVSLLLAVAIFRFSLWEWRTMLGLLAVLALGLAGYLQRTYMCYTVYTNLGWPAVNTVLLAVALWRLRVPWAVSIVQRIRPARGPG